MFIHVDAQWSFISRMTQLDIERILWLCLNPSPMEDLRQMPSDKLGVHALQCVTRTSLQHCIKYNRKFYEQRCRLRNVKDLYVLPRAFLSDTVALEAD